jgi:hypothetical protein
MSGVGHGLKPFFWEMIFSRGAALIPFFVDTYIYIYIYTYIYTHIHTKIHTQENKNTSPIKKGGGGQKIKDCLNKNDSILGAAGQSSDG